MRSRALALLVVMVVTGAIVAVAAPARAQDPQLSKLRKEIRDTSAAGQFKDALATIETFRERNDPRDERKAELDGLRDEVLEHARKRAKIEVANADAAYAKGTPAAEIIAGLEAAASQMPDDLAPPIREKAKEIKVRDDEAKARALLGSKFVAARDEALAKGKLEDAERAVAEAARETKLAPIPAEVARFKSDTEEVVRAWRTFDATVDKLGSDEKHAYRTRDGKTLEGVLRAYDGARWLAEVKAGRREAVPLDLYEVAPDELLRWTLSREPAPVPELHGSALYFTFRSEPAAAALALDKLAAQGKDDAALRERVKKLEPAVPDRRVQRAVALVVARASGSPTWAVQAIRELTAKHGSHPAFATGADGLRKAFIGARAALLSTSDAGRFFHAKHSSTPEGIVKLEYDMKDPAQLGDFAADESAVKGSHVKLEGGKLLVRGKVLHAAVWQGGELAVELSAQTGNPKRPNLNVTISDKGGWNALLVGAGFAYGGVTRLRIHPSAPDRDKLPLEVPLPAHVVIDLAGKEPQEEGVNLFAKEKPKVPESRLRMSIARTAKGALRSLVAGQSAVSIKESPRSEDDGSVGFLPATTEVSIDRLEILGRLDPKAIADRVREIAESEAASVFPAKAPAGDGGGPK